MAIYYLFRRFWSCKRAAHINIERKGRVGLGVGVRVCVMVEVKVKIKITSNKIETKMCRMGTINE